MQKTLLLVTGPAGVGKRPFVEALMRILAARGVSVAEVPVLSPRPLVREPLPPGMRALRTDEVPALDPRRYVLEIVRETPNAVDLDEVDAALGANDVVVVVAYHTLVHKIVEHARVREAADELRVVTVFLSPFLEEEITSCTHPEHFLPGIMSGRQSERALREAVRARRMVESSAVVGALYRATTLLSELSVRKQFGHRLVLRDGYLPETWDSDPPAGDAGKALAALLEILGV